MAISTDYPRPITVNGFLCHNCDDVSNARKNIDPAEANGARFLPFRSVARWAIASAPMRSRPPHRHSACSTATPEQMAES